MKLRNEGWPIGLLLAMFVTAATTARFLPGTLPIHWSNGEADQFASRSVALLFIPLWALAFYITLALVSRQHEDDEPEHVWWWARTISTAGLAAFYVDMQIAFWGYGSHPTILLGIALIALGWLRPFASNALIGVRTKWTLSSDRSWRRSNQLFRRISLGLGWSILFLAVLGPPHLMELSVGVSLLAATGVVLYSYVEWRKDFAK